MTDSSALLFIASDRRELEPWVSNWDLPHPLDLPVHWARAGKWRGRDVVAIANGVGVKRAILAVNAAKIASRNFSAICSIGTGGGLDPALAIGDIIVAASVTNGESNWLARDPKGPPARSGLVRTSPHIARTSAEKRNLRDSGAIIVEMEAAGVACAAKELDVPFYCVRVVSDLADETFFIDFEKFLTPNGRFNVPSLIMNALVHPAKAFPELLRLQKRTSMASKQLGDFLADCEF